MNPGAILSPDDVQKITDGFVFLLRCLATPESGVEH
jgi:hypothetical protein